MLSIKLRLAPRRFRFAILSILTGAMLMCVARAQDVSIITRAGQKQMLANPGTELVGARKPDVTIV
jgi:hypothetical protein